MVSDYTDSLLEDCMALMNKAFKQLEDNYDNYINELTSSLKTMNNDRNNTHIFCMCEKYNLNSMWAHYCNNKGLVIEYDFNKVLNLDIDTLKKCLSLYKVEYHNKPLLEFSKVFKSYFEEKEDELFDEGSSMISQMITKDKSWSFEKEWRLILLNIEERFPLDIVSGLYMDYELYNERKCKKLLSLAKKKKWNVYIRTPNDIKNGYIYKKINDSL